MKEKVIVICGPTASGKTSLGIQLAQKLKSEVISCDSMQIYKEMDIGSAKPTAEEQSQAVHHLIDYVELETRYSVADFKKDCENKIKELLDKNMTPIIVGGTGLYVDSLIYNINFKETKTDLTYREELSKIPLEELYKKAVEIDPEAMKKISMNDRKRIQRILEIFKSTGKNKTELEKSSREEVKYDYHVFVLTMPRDILYDRINRRVDLMIEQGLIEEVRSILSKHTKIETAMQGLGYKEVKEYLDGDISKEEMIEKIKKETRHFAKRQITWFKKYDTAHFIEAGNPNNCNYIIKEVMKSTEEKN